MRPYIIGITGGSGCGKTLFIKRIMKDFSNEEVCLVSQDNYYRPRNEQPVDENGVQNFDRPESIDITKFTHDLKKLIDGEVIRIKEYTFNNPELDPEIIEFQPASVIILEGIFIFYVKEISKLIDLKVFVDAPEHGRPRGGDDQLPLFARWNLVSLLVQDLGLDAREGFGAGPGFEWE